MISTGFAIVSVVADVMSSERVFRLPRVVHLPQVRSLH